MGDSDGLGAEEAHVEAVGKVLAVMDFCQEHGVDFDEVIESARQSWAPEE